MKEKLGAALFCLAFALPFGGVGVGASWVLGRMIYDAHRAEDWVRVKATVDSYDHGKVAYRYTFQGVEHRGDRLGANPIGGIDDVDSWHDDMYSMLSAAKSEGKPITVWVNPDAPAESMVDRTLRWKLAAFTLPFAFGFGGVGLGAVWMFFRTLSTRPLTPVPSKPGGGAVGLWIFTFFWNAISVPIAMLVVPDAIAEGEWAGLFVLIFPLIGALLLWGAIAATIKSVRNRFARQAVTPVAPARPAHDGVFARGMIDDVPAVAGGAAIDTFDTGMPAPPDPTVAELERLSGKKLDERQREMLAKMDPKHREMMAKFAGWVGKMKRED